MPNYTEEQRQQWAENRQKNLDFATETLQKGVEAIFQSEQYQEYLKVMSRFPTYSVNNTILIAMQRPEASLVCSFGHWKKFGRNVKKGAHGIKIYAPMPYTKTVERELRDPDTKEIMRDSAGHPMTEEAEVKRMSFKVVSVFDYADTEGKELPSLGVNALTGEVAEYDRFIKALDRTAKIPVTLAPIEGGANGYYDRAANAIVLREGMSQQQTIKTLIHEIAHSLLHSEAAEEAMEKSERPDKNTREVQAESIAFVVCSRYGIDTSDYSFPYVSSWSAGKDTPELKASLKVIQETSSTLIDEIDQHLEEIQREQTVEHETAYLLENGDVITAEPTQDGWNYAVYDSTLVYMESGTFPDAKTADDVRDEALERFGMVGAESAMVDFAEMKAQIHRSEETGLPPIVFPYLDKEGQITCDTAVEPVVTISKSDLPQLRDGMKLPLHIADKLFAQMEQQQIKEHGKQDRQQCPSTNFQIDYRSDGKDGRYSGIFYAGSGNGGLLLHIERAANRRKYYLEQHPDQGNMDSCRQILGKMLPTFYQQSIRGENRAMDKVLPQPVPLHNVTHDEAVDNPAIGSKAFYESHRETVRCAHAIDEGLERAFHHKATYQFLDGMNREFGQDRVKLVFARTVQLRDYDGRFRSENKDYAAAVPVRNVSADINADMTQSYNLNVHPVVIDAALSAFRKMEQSRKPSIRKRLEESRKAPEKTTQQREHTQKRSSEHEL